MSEAKPPKLYTNKPKKSRVKQFQEKQKVGDASYSVAPQASLKMGSTPPPAPPPKLPRESFARRYKFLWPMLLTVNLAVGAYLFMRTKKKDEYVVEEEADSVVEESLARPPAIVENAKVREPIPVAQQRELFKWILEEKQKIKPKDREEKKRIEEEKAMLKEFIKAKSFPIV